MPTVNKRYLKSWMLVYAGFVVAITAAKLGEDARSDMGLDTAGFLPSGITIEETYFRPKVAESQRNDI